MGVLTRTKKRAKLPSTGHGAVLKVVHPRGYVEVFWEPITAGEIMRRYPRHCVARPDFFEFPWIVVCPESVLVPGKVFYIVPYHTMDKIIKAKMQEVESLNLSSRDNQSAELYENDQNSKGRVLPVRNYRRQSQNHESNISNDEESCCSYMPGHDSDQGSNEYKESFYRTWNKMRRNIHISHEESYDQLDLGLDLPLDNGRPHFNPMRTTSSPEHAELRRLSSCFRKTDSIRKKLNLKVSFASPLIPCGRSRSPSD